VVTPEPILLARELFADLLLGSGQLREALTEYESVLGKEPNRYRAIAGATQAAEQSGDKQKAVLFAADLVKHAATASGSNSCSLKSLVGPRLSGNRGRGTIVECSLRNCHCGVIAFS
jgi:hypothetical protein